MPSSEPIKNLMKAVQSLEQGQRQTSAIHLANALGGNPTPMIQENLNQLLNVDSAANDIVLEIVSSEVNKGRRDYSYG
jgi:hypothetical protein